MNKEDLEAKLHNYEERLKDVTKAIKETREQLAEAEKLEELDKLLEKPKLRLGDFGITTRESVDEYDKFVVIETPKGKLEPLYQNGQTDGCNYAKGNPNDYTIFGNVYDLLKERSEPLTEFKLDVHKYFIDSRADISHAPIYMAGNWHTLSEVEEHRHKLSRLIATYKRKENKCS